MKASLGLIQSLRTERKHSEDKYTVLKDKAAKHLAAKDGEIEKRGRRAKRVEKERDEMHALL